MEIQAVSELYNRPIEIYTHSIKPLKTFHEGEESYKRNYERSEYLTENNIYKEYYTKMTSYPIKLSYHGRAHYNSIVPIDESIYKETLLKTVPGEYENHILDKVKEKIMMEKEKMITQQNNDSNKIVINDIDNKTIMDIFLGRLNFKDKSKIFIFNKIVDKDIDTLLEENLNKSDDNTKNEKKIEEVIKQTEITDIEDEFMKLAIINSKKDTKIPDKPDEMDLTTHPSILFLIDSGFTIEEAVTAYSAVGEDPDLMLQYLYSLNLN
jgi:hypothetical protein